MLIQRILPEVKLFLTLMCGIFLGFSFSLLLHRTDRLSRYDESSTCCSGAAAGASSNAVDAKSGEYPELSEEEPAAAADTLELLADTLLRRQVAAQGIGAVAAAASNNNNNNSSSTLAAHLFNETRVLCWILTSPKNHAKRAIYVKTTWGARCNKLLFMSTEDDAALGAIKLPVREGRANLWQKTREAAKYIYEHHYDDYDWFFKADDDTYVIMENLRAFLYPFATDAPVYFGCKFKTHVRQGYMSGGAGYVLSKEALRRFVLLAYPNPIICRQRSGGAEDKEMGFCLQNIGVVAGDSRDAQNRGRFFPSGPQSHLVPRDKSHWYWRYIFYATEDGLECCSNYAISFHYITPNFFYVLDYLIYHLQPFGIGRQMERLPVKANMTSLMEKWKTGMSDNPL